MIHSRYSGFYTQDNWLPRLRSGDPYSVRCMSPYRFCLPKRKVCALYVAPPESMARSVALAGQSRRFSARKSCAFQSAYVEALLILMCHATSGCGLLRALM